MTFGQRILGDGSLFRNAEMIVGSPRSRVNLHDFVKLICLNVRTTPKLIGAIRCFAEHCDRGFRDEVV